MTRISRRRIPAAPDYLPKEIDHDDSHPRQAPNTGRSDIIICATACCTIAPSDIT